MLVSVTPHRQCAYYDCMYRGSKNGWNPCKCMSIHLTYLRLGAKVRLHTTNPRCFEDSAIFTTTMPGKWIDSYQRGQIVALYRYAHWPIQRISDTLRIFKTTVHRIATQSETTEPTTPPRPRERRPVCTTRKRQRLVNRLRLSTENRRLPLDRLANLEDLHYDIRTLRRALRQEGYSRRIARAKPLLTEAHKLRRLQWATNHLDWSDRQWSRVIWTDEASIRCGHFGQVYITRTAGEEFEPDCLVARFRKYSACMVWGAISSNGPSQLHIFEKGKIDGARYRTEILPRLSQII